MKFTRSFKAFLFAHAVLWLTSAGATVQRVNRCDSAFTDRSVYAVPQPLPQPKFISWADETLKRIAGVDEATTSDLWRYNMPVRIDRELKPISPSSASESSRISRAIRTYVQNFGRDSVQSLIWTGIESGNPLTRNEDYRWDSLGEQGLYDRTKRKKIIESLLSTGIRNVRMGLSNDKIDLNDSSSWRPYDEMMTDMAKAGLRISLDLHHFGIEDRFREVDEHGHTIGEKSYYLNSAWPDYFARFARAAVERYGSEIKAITIMNEPETVAGFNGEMWHGGFPGWSDARTNHVYIQRSIQVARASVQARLAIEDYLQTLPTAARPRFTYMHTEAAVFKAYWNDFNLYRRFLISDLILGHEWIVRADLDWLKTVPMNQLEGRWARLRPDQRTNFDWVIENFVIYNRSPELRESDRQSLVALLGTLQSRHLELARRFRKSMRTDTVFAVDYYAHNEDKSNDGVRLNPEPQFYASEIREGRRAGLYDVMVDYYNHFKMPMMIGETGTPYFYYGARWAQQALLESAQAARQGVPFLGMTLYPLVDTYGWETALSVPKGAGVLFNPSGLLQLVPDEPNADVRAKTEYKPRPFVQVLMGRLRGL